MDIKVRQDGNLQLEKVFEPIIIKTSDVAEFHICQRGVGLDIVWNGKQIYLTPFKNGKEWKENQACFQKTNRIKEATDIKNIDEIIKEWKKTPQNLQFVETNNNYQRENDILKALLMKHNGMLDEEIIKYILYPELL